MFQINEAREWIKASTKVTFLFELLKDLHQ